MTDFTVTVGTWVDANGNTRYGVSSSEDVGSVSPTTFNGETILQLSYNASSNGYTVELDGSHGQGYLGEVHFQGEDAFFGTGSDAFASPGGRWNWYGPPIRPDRDLNEAWNGTTGTVRSVSLNLPDSTAPTLNSLTINSAGTQMAAAFDENVTSGAGGFNGFTLDLSGGAVTASYASGDGTSSLVYTLSRTVFDGETGTADYVQPGDGIEDTAGNNLASITDQAITNNSTAEPDTTPPTLSTAAIDSAGTSVALTFDENVTSGADGFNDVTLNFTRGAVTATYSSGDGTSSLTYTLSRTLYDDETGTLDYDQPGDGIQDTSGNLLASIADRAVTNNSTQNAPPTLTSLAIDSSGDVISLGFDEVVTAGADGFGGLTLSLSGGAATATYNTGDGTAGLQYSLSRTVQFDETGTASYTQPGDGIQDLDGTLLATFSGEAVANHSNAGAPVTLAKVAKPRRMRRM